MKTAPTEKPRPSPLRPAVDGFVDRIVSTRRLAPNTVAAYRRDLARLRAFCEAEGIADWDRLNVHQARRFVAVQHQRGLSARSIQRVLSAARAFYRHLLRERTVRASPFEGLSGPRAGKRLPRTLSVDQAVRLVDLPAGDSLALRDHAILELLYSSGLRLAELTGLDLEGLDLAEATVRVTGKGARTRIVPVGRQAVVALAAWLRARGGHAAPDTRAVFVSRTGRRLSRRSVQRVVSRWATQQGLDRPVSPHMLRHSFASHVLESSGDLRAVQEMLGHANLSTTQIYTHLDFQHLARVYDQAHPRARKRR